MRRIQAVLGLVGVAFLWGGCASPMMVFTEPGNAEVLVDGQLIGRSPILYEGSSAWNGGVKVTARLPEYQESAVEVSRELAPWGWYLPDSVRIRLEPMEE